MRGSAFFRLAEFVRNRGSRAAGRSPAFVAFRRQFFEDADVRRDGFDLEPLRALEGGERRLAERMLIAALPDSRALLGLSALASPRAIRRLRAIFAGAGRDGGLLIAAAAACYACDPNPRYALAVAERLRTAPAASERRDAAAALAQMPVAEVEDALDGALDDLDPMVRHHAARALLTLYGAPVDATGMRALAQRIVAREPARLAYRGSPGAVM